jgi:flagellar motor switch protein FliG
VKISYLIWFLVGLIWAQNPQRIQYDISDKASDYYEKLIHQHLSTYYNPKSFLVEARVYVEDVLIPIAFQRNSKRIQWDLDALPGLPVLPEELKIIMESESADSLIPSQYRKESSIRYIEIVILIDQDLASEDMDFIFQSVKMKGKLDEFRGDRIQIQQKNFPTRTSIAPSRTPENIPTTYDSIQTEEINSNSPPYIWILSGLLFFAFLLIILLIFRLIGQNSPDAGMKLFRKMRKEFVESNSQQMVPTPAVTVTETKPSAPVVNEEKRKHAELRTFLLNQLIGEPSQVSRVIKSWIQVRKEEGIHHCAILLNLADPKVISILKNHLPEDMLIKLELRMLHLETTALEDEIKWLEEFLKDYQNSTASQGSYNKQGDIFSFLDQLTLHQIRHLISEENVGIKGLVLAQITAEKAAEIMSAMEEQVRASVLVSMAQINQLTIRTYKEIAERLSQKALSIANMKFVVADGISSIISVLLGLPTQSQGDYLRRIAEMDLELSLRIRTFFVPFENLIDIESKQLLLILDSFDPERLALAMMQTENDFVSRILTVFPDRARERILSAMEGFNERSIVDVENSRRELLSHIHHELKKKGGLRL